MIPTTDDSTDISDMLIPLGKAIITYILIAIIVIVKVTAAADILCLLGVDDAYFPFTAHGYWIQQPYFSLFFIPSDKSHQNKSAHTTQHICCLQKCPVRICIISPSNIQNYC